MQEKIFDNLYTDIGAKIKDLAKWMFFIEAIGAIIYGLSLLTTGIGFLIIIFGPLVAWVSSWILYAFGELVEDVHAMRTKYYPPAEEDAAKREAEKEAAKRKAEEDAARRKEEEEAAKRKAEEEQLHICDIEDAASAYLKRRVSISDIACTLIYVIPKKTGNPTEMHLNLSVGDQEFSSLDLFFDRRRKAYYFKGRELALDGAWRSIEEIFGFDVALFKSFTTEVDADD